VRQNSWKPKDFDLVKNLVEKGWQNVEGGRKSGRKSARKNSARKVKEDADDLETETEMFKDKMNTLTTHSDSADE
jgi:hypothetical protein